MGNCSNTPTPEKFTNVLLPLSDGPQKNRIRDALRKSVLDSEMELRSTVDGMTRPQIAQLLSQCLEMCELDASALAGVLVIRIRQALVPTSLLSIYKRRRLTLAPAFDDVVGNLRLVAQKIEETLVSQINSESDLVKENHRFVCIINPPRHGKSLLLDTIFATNDDFLVIPITYNSVTNLIPSEELVSPQVALTYFWLRVLKTILNLDLPLSDLIRHYSHISSFNAVKQLCEPNLAVSPFSVEGRNKKIVICVDEFSHLTDHIESSTWTMDEKKEFLSYLQNEMTYQPLLRYVMTGFTTYMSKLLNYSSALVDVYSLDMCSFSESRPLLKKIVKMYEEQKPPIPVPASLFEAIKCTPGLVGLWAECIVHHKRFDRDLIEFHQNAAPNWLIRICDAAHLLVNWKLILRYLKFLECQPKGTNNDVEAAELSSELAKHQIGLSSTQTSSLQVIPLCFALIVISMKQSEHFDQMAQQERDLIWILHQAITICGETPFTFGESNGKNNKNGSYFEKFVCFCLKARLLLHGMRSDSSISTAISCLVRRSRLIPGKEYACQINLPHNCPSPPKSDLSFTLHVVSTKTELFTFLLSPLYYLFPLTTAALHDDFLQRSQSNLSIFLQSPVFSHRYSPKHVQGHKDSNCKLVVDLSREETLDVMMPRHPVKDDDIWNELLSLRGSQMSDIINYAKEKISSKVDGVVKGWYAKLLSNLKKLLDAIESGCSVFPLVDCQEGCDMLLIWRERDENEVTETDTLIPQTETIHLALIELKDQRQTPVDKWQSKTDAMASPRCLLWWVKILLKPIECHVVLAGREHVVEENERKESEL